LACRSGADPTRGRRRLLVWFAAALPIAALHGCGVREPSGGAGRPSILMIVVDALRADALGCYGAGARATPALDRLAAGGIRFERAFAPSSWTKPSIASLLTGLYPSQHRCLHGLLEDAGRGSVDGLNPRLVTMAERLRAAGYATAVVQTNPHVHARFGFAQGFERSVDLSYRDDHRVSVAARGLLRELRAPFFLYLHYLAPHVPYKPHPDGPFAPLSPRYAAGVGFGHSDLAAWARRRRPPSPQLLAELRQLYRGEVFYADQQIGGVLAQLRRLDLARRTLVVVTADHGEEFGEHGGLEHGHSLFPEVLRVPLILAGPGLPRGQSSSRLASLIDLFPTVLDLVGLEPQPNLPGESLRRFQAPRDARRLLAEGVLWGAPQEALIEPPYQLIRGPRTVVTALGGSHLPPRGAIRLRTRLAGALQRLRAALRPQVGAAPQQRIAPELIEHLHSLGYLR